MLIHTGEGLVCYGVFVGSEGFLDRGIRNPSELVDTAENIDPTRGRKVQSIARRSPTRDHLL